MPSHIHIQCVICPLAPLSCSPCLFCSVINSCDHLCDRFAAVLACVCVCGRAQRLGQLVQFLHSCEDKGSLALFSKHVGEHYGKKRGILGPCVLAKFSQKRPDGEERGCHSFWCREDSGRFLAQAASCVFVQEHTISDNCSVCYSKVFVCLCT